MAYFLIFVLAVVLVTASWGLAAMSLLTCSRAPVYQLWKPAIVAKEWGHWLAVFSIALAVVGIFGAGFQWMAFPGVFAAVLFLSPAVRAIVLAASLPKRMDSAFGPRVSEPGEVGKSGNPSRFVPLSIVRLIHTPIPPVELKRMVYSEADGVQLTLDLYLSRSETDQHTRGAGLILVIHGGSWATGDSAQLSGMNRYLAARGFTVAAINYRLAPRFNYPAPLEDICHAIAFIQKAALEQGFNAQPIVLLGRSAGGQLALSAAYDQQWMPAGTIRGVIALYAPTDFIWSWMRPSPRRISDSNGVIQQFLGGTPEQIPEVFDRASPIRHVSSESVPTLLIHGGQDELVSPFQSTRLAMALSEAGTRHLHVEVPWGNHGMDANLSGPSGQITLYLIERFLESLLSSGDTSA